MKTITFLNVEKLVFLDSKLRKLLPDFQTLFNSYGLSQQAPELRGLGQKMILDFVNQAEDKHLKVMKEYFNEDVEVQKVDSNVATHLDFSIHEAQDCLNSNSFVKEALTIYREGDRLYISAWR